MPAARTIRCTCGTAENGFVLDFGSLNEKTTSTVSSTQGYLSLITFTPDSVSPCATNGSSFRYRFFFLTGKGGYNRTRRRARCSDYRQDLGEGMAASTPVDLAAGRYNRHDSVLRRRASNEEPTAGTIRTIKQNWKEQQQ